MTRARIGRVRDRESFKALRRSERRGRSDGVSATWVPAAEGGCRVAFAVPRRVGTAVVRNRLRRRLRAGFADLAAAGTLPSGTYLLGAGPGATDHDGAALLGHLRAALDRSGAR